MSPANKVSGGMKFVAGIHKQQVQHEETFDQNNLLTTGEAIAVDVDEFRAVFVELKPGQASLHHVLLFHGSEPNRSDAGVRTHSSRLVAKRYPRICHARNFQC